MAGRHAPGAHGGDPSDRVGDLQVVDDVEAFDTWTLYEAWLEQELAGGAVSLRAGLLAVDRSSHAVGVWGYTSELDRFSPGAGGAPRTRRGTFGVYALAEQRVFVERRDPRQGLAVFARLGLADAAVNPLDADVEAGLVYRGALPGRDADRLAFGVAAAHLSQPFRESLAASGRRSDPWEVALELTYLARLTPWLELQPDLQLVIDPGRVPGLANAWVLGARAVVSF